MRDTAILTLLLGTGIRVSECVGINLDDVDYINDRIKIVRKGGYESFVYYGEEVRQALLDYMEERDELEPMEGHENALFLSSQRRRITVRSIELLVKSMPPLSPESTLHRISSEAHTEPISIRKPETSI